MRIGRLGAMIGAGGLLLLSLAVIAGIVSGDGVGIGSVGPGGVLLGAAFGLLATGCLIVSFAAGPTSSQGSGLRSALAILGLGNLLLLASALGSSLFSPASIQPVIAALLGIPVTLIGLAALAITLPNALRSRSPRDQ